MPLVCTLALNVHMFENSTCAMYDVLGALSGRKYNGLGINELRR